MRKKRYLGIIVSPPRPLFRFFFRAPVVPSSPRIPVQPFYQFEAGKIRRRRNGSRLVVWQRAVSYTSRLAADYSICMRIDKQNVHCIYLLERVSLPAMLWKGQNQVDGVDEDGERGDYHG